MLPNSRPLSGPNTPSLTVTWLAMLPAVNERFDSKIDSPSVNIFCGMGSKTGIEVKGRFAPSPTGRMHLGNVASALVSWLSAKSKGGEWLLRIEDLDRGRSRHEYARLIEDDLSWLGLEWDEGGLDDRGCAGPYSQSRRDDIYRHFLQSLNSTGMLYECRCTRADIMAANAPHQSDGRVIYPGTCRPLSLPMPLVGLDSRAALRLAVPDKCFEVDDFNYGKKIFNLASDCGDFIVRKSDGGFAYQLAVVVDDALMGVTEVVRGRDLLLSAAQQNYIYELLGFAAPQYGHVPLLVNGHGQRLSKRDASLSLEVIRSRYNANEVIGMIAHALGLISEPCPISAQDLLPMFDWSKLPTDDIVIASDS